MNTKSILASALALGLMAASMSEAADVKLSGSLDWSMLSEYNSKFVPHYYSNHNLGLQALTQMDQGTSLTLGLRSVSLDSNGQESAINGGKALAESASARKAQFDIEKITFGWTFMPGAELRIGDTRMSSGKINSFEPFSEERHFGTIFKERSVRGVGLKASGFEGVFGLTDTKNGALEGIFSYTVPLISNRIQTLSVKPVIEIVKNGGRSRSWLAGSDFNYSTSLYGVSTLVNGALGLLPDDKSDQFTQTVLVEPSFNYGRYSLALSMYHAFLADTSRSAIEQTELPVQDFLGLEPMVNVWSNKMALSLPFTWLNPSAQISNDDSMRFKPTVGFFPSEQASFFVAAGYTIPNYSGPKTWLAEIKTKIKF